MLLRLIESWERMTQALILVVSATLYALSCLFLASILMLTASTAIKITTVILLLLMLVGHGTSKLGKHAFSVRTVAVLLTLPFVSVLAFAGLGTLFDVATTTFLVSWSLRLAVQDNLGPGSTVSDFVSYLLPLLTGALLSAALLAVPFVFLDEQAYELEWRSALLNWHNLRFLSIASGLLYLYELYGTLQANVYHDWGFWRAIQAILFVALAYIRFALRLRELRQ